MSGPYEDIIHLPHHVSETRARMSLADRAAQFSPFAALTGYDAAVAETARLTDCQVELAVDAKAEIDETLSWLLSHLSQGPRAAVTHFVPDERKAGGAYIRHSGTVLRLNRQEKWLLLDCGEKIFFKDILALEVLTA